MRSYVVVDSNGRDGTPARRWLMAPKAVCSRCGVVYRGWALVDMDVVECEECGVPLTVELEPQVPDLCEAGFVGAAGQTEKGAQADTQ